METLTNSTMTEQKKKAKQCAIICVDEIILTLNKDIRDLDVVGNVLLDLIDFWRKVRNEIINYKN